MNDPAQCRVLIAKDNALIAQHLKKLLSMMGYTCSDIVLTYDDLEARAVTDPPDLLLMDIDLGGIRSIDLIPLLQERGVRIVCISGYSPEVMATPPEVIRLPKPVEAHALKAVLAG